MDTRTPIPACEHAILGTHHWPLPGLQRFPSEARIIVSLRLYLSCHLWSLSHTQSYSRDMSCYAGMPCTLQWEQKPLDKLSLGPFCYGCAFSSARVSSGKAGSKKQAGLFVNIVLLAFLPVFINLENSDLCLAE